MIFFLFSLDDVRSMISKNWNLDSSNHSTLSYFQWVRLRWAQAKRRHLWFCIFLISDIWLIAFALHGLNLHFKMQRWTVFTDKVFLSTCTVVIPFSATWGVKGHMHSKLVFHLTPYMPRLDSLTHLMMSWMVDGEILKFLEIEFFSWETISNCGTIFHRVVNLTPSLLVSNWAFRSAFNEPVYLWTFPNRCFLCVPQHS